MKVIMNDCSILMKMTYLQIQVQKYQRVLKNCQLSRAGHILKNAETKQNAKGICLPTYHPD